MVAALAAVAAQSGLRQQPAVELTHATAVMLAACVPASTRGAIAHQYRQLCPELCTLRSKCGPIFALARLMLRLIPDV